MEEKSFAGNGGSFADAQHLTAEFICKLNSDRNPLPAIALGTNSSSVTATGNDYGFNYVFSRELEALGSSKDFLIAISTSGSSKNIIYLLKKAKELKMPIALLTGPKKILKLAFMQISSAILLKFVKKLWIYNKYT